MADSVTLSAAVRESLLSLQNTSQLIKRTQSRLASGLRVESAIDDPVSFFQAKSLSDRAFDFSERKDAIDQGISTVTAALDGVEGIEELVRQLQRLRISTIESGVQMKPNLMATRADFLQRPDACGAERIIHFAAQKNEIAGVPAFSRFKRSEPNGGCPC